MEHDFTAFNGIGMRPGMTLAQRSALVMERGRRLAIARESHDADFRMMRDAEELRLFTWKPADRAVAQHRYYEDTV
jgi:hypothetical protein